MKELNKWFERTDSPSKGSLVGKLMAKVLENHSLTCDFETLRIECREILLGIGGAQRIQKAYNRWKIAQNAKKGISVRV
jgi:hypothetical protein